MPSKKPSSPLPYNESAVPKKDRFWECGPHAYEDSWEANLPSASGFISDFHSHLRGYETPTAFCIWTAVFFLSSAIKRDAWIAWADEKLYANFYVIFVGPPGVVKKGTTISHGYRVFHDCYKHLQIPTIRMLKGLVKERNGDGSWDYNFRIVKNKATPEALVKMMDVGSKSSKKMQLDKNTTVSRKATSEVSIVVPELAVLLGKKEYASTTTELLMDLYDPQDDWHNETIGRGSEHLRYLCTNFLGATTPKGLQQSIPAVATEDGFISRCIMVFQRRSSRRFSMPIKSGLGLEELSKRLAWIAEHTLGEHTLSPDARIAFDSWYNEWKDELEEAIEQPYASSRFDVQVLKLALILKASRYDAGKVIQKQDVLDAIRIMRRTAATYTTLFNEVRSEGFFTKLGKVEKFIRNKREATRREILNSARITSTDLDAIITHLMQTSKIQVVRPGGKEADYMKRTSDERYRYVRGAKEEEE